MSRRNIIRKYQVLTDADSTSDPVSIVTDVSGVDFITYQLEIGASVDTELEVQFCNDDSQDFKPLNFGQSVLLIGSVDQDHMAHIENKGFKFLRLSIADNGGSGNINAWVSGNGRGA